MVDLPKGCAKRRQARGGAIAAQAGAGRALQRFHAVAGNADLEVVAFEDAAAAPGAPGAVRWPVPAASGWPGNDAPAVQRRGSPPRGHRR
ncbi:hypothetical protein G6F31_021593 [Rhizopus arrhizus]|nr:hypothetical protein G6F31_021593 [Rhizopus arrhizus]